MSTTSSSTTNLDHIRDLGVAWMNRGHTLMQRSDAPSLTDALAAYDHAIAVLCRLPANENPSWTNSLGAALMNRGQLLHRLHGVKQAAFALGTFTEAETILHPLVPAIENPAAKIENLPSPWPRRNLAGTQLNRASLLLDLAEYSTAASTTRHALALTAPYEHTDAVDADLTLKIRRCLCDALGQLIVEPETDQNAIATEASDLVDDALALIRHWTARHAAVFAPLALRFFRYGTQLYRLHQPHFLADFIEENIFNSGPEFHSIALEAIDSALTDRPNDQKFLTIGDPASEQLLTRWRELTSLRSRLVA